MISSFKHELNSVLFSLDFVTCVQATDQSSLMAQSHDNYFWTAWNPTSLFWMNFNNISQTSILQFAVLGYFWISFYVSPSVTHIEYWPYLPNLCHLHLRFYRHQTYPVILIFIIIKIIEWLKHCQESLRNLHQYVILKHSPFLFHYFY